MANTGETSRGKSVQEQRRAAKNKARRAQREARRTKPLKQSRSLTFIIINASGIALVGTMLCVLLFRSAIAMGVAVNQELQSLVVMIGFLVLFLGSLVILMNKYMPRGWLESQEQRLTRQTKGFKPPKQKWGGALADRPQRFEKVFDDQRVSRAAAPASLEDGDGFSSDMTMPNAGPAGVEQDINATSPADDSGLEDAEPLTDQITNEETGTESAPSKADSDPEKMTKVLEQLKDIIVAVSHVLQSRGGKIDRHGKFGLNLYFAGACSKLSRHFALTADEGRALLARLMEMTGANKSAAHAFAKSVNAYGEHPTYRTMIDAGNKTISIKLDESDETGPDLRTLLDDWSAAEEETEIPTTHTFMFTDIVDSAELTTQLGNMTMQNVVRTHNKTARLALECFDGRELQHTGDGLMAKFNTGRSAVNAAIQIQQEVDLFNRQEPDLAFVVRIGLHVGEAILDGKQYFGAAVQKTAAICAEADPEEIWVSNDIYEACNEDTDLFTYCGDYTLQGAKKPERLFIVEWQPIPDKTNTKIDYQDIGRK